MKIIVAEDELRALKGMKNLISSINPEYEVIGEASDGRQALELILALNPDLVITDIKMPYMNGLELIKAVRQYRLSVHFIIISAFAEFEFAKQAMSMGVKEYLLKPFTYDEVDEALNRIESEIEGKTAYPKSKESIVKEYPNAHYLVLRAISIIETSYAAKISQSSIAEKLGLTKEYFSYLFHKETGVKFTDFINNYRIELAKHILIHKDFKINEVSSQVGFSDEKYFCRVFKKNTGYSPNAYKNMHK